MRCCCCCCTVIVGSESEGDAWDGVVFVRTRGLVDAGAAFLAAGLRCCCHVFLERGIGEKTRANVNNN